MTTPQPQTGPYSDPPRRADEAPKKAAGGAGWKAWVLGIALLLVLIIALQNAQEVEMDFLFIHTEAPLFAALLLAAALGAVIGYILPVLRRHRRGEH